MTQVKIFTFNDFQENTYILYDNQKAWIIDPGCSNINERRMVEAFLKKESLQPELIINTHCHIDHVLGNKWCVETFGIPLYIPDGEQKVLASLSTVAGFYGLTAEVSPLPDHLMQEGDELLLDNRTWQLISAPGHSPASICLYQAEEKILIAGDVLFFESIGRTDLPGGNHQQLLTNIHLKLLVLPDDVIVYSGHGPSTTIGHERAFNPFLS